MSTNLRLAAVWLLKRLKINSSRTYLQEFVEQASKSVGDGSRVLDAGAGEAPYRFLFNRSRYESVDFCQVDKVYGHISIVSDLKNLPINENVYDLVVCTQVLEHVPSPIQVIQELARVLKPGAALWLSAPLFYAEHETPYDFFRYTQFGLQQIVEQAGLSIERIEWLEGYHGTLSYQLESAAKILPLRVQDYGGGIIGSSAVILALVLKPLFGLLSILYARLDLRNKYVERGMCKNYILVARKVK